VGTDLAFDALADPVRREILGVLAAGTECSAGQIAEQITSVGRTGVSSHLRVLRASGLVTERRDGRFRLYALDPAGPARDVLAFLQQLFEASLDDVRAAAEAEPRPRARRAQ
jgi:ArsR family transcriptional regulator, arsenate/arsenite/antimonite-responsive transcriptional repressor